MKKIITFLLLSICFSISAKSDSIKIGRNTQIFFRPLKTEFNPKKIDLNNHTNYQVDLHLNMISKPKDKFDYDYKSTGVCMLIAGVAFTAASILEGDSQYGTYISTTSSNTTTYKYVVPPFYQQQPRFTMFLIGVGFTLGGFGLTISK